MAVLVRSRLYAHCLCRFGFVVPVRRLTACIQGSKAAFHVHRLASALVCTVYCPSCGAFSLSEPIACKRCTRSLFWPHVLSYSSVSRPGWLTASTEGVCESPLHIRVRSLAFPFLRPDASTSLVVLWCLGVYKSTEFGPLRLLPGGFSDCSGQSLLFPV